MTAIRNIIPCAVLIAALMLLSAEAAATFTTIIIKLAGILLLATLPALWRKAPMARDRRIIRFINED